jgi:hypothetical protein
MKAMSLALFIFLVAGLAVAKEDKKSNQPVVSPIPGCACTGLNKNTGQPWTNEECKIACESKRALQHAMGNPEGILSSFNAPLSPAPATEDQPQAKISDVGTGKDRLKSRIIFGTLLGGLGFVSLIGFVAWKSDLLQTMRRKKKRRYRTDQEKAVLVSVQLPSAPLVTAEPAATRPPNQVVLAPVRQMQTPATDDYPEEVVDVSHDRGQLENIVNRLESWVNPEVFPWATWGRKISAFTMERWGWQPEIRCFAGGMEISIQADNEHLCYLVLLNAVRCLQVPLRLVIIEQSESGSLFTLMPEQEVLFALSSDGNVFTLTEGVRKLLRPGHEIERAVNE